MNTGLMDSDLGPGSLDSESPGIHDTLPSGPAASIVYPDFPNYPPDDAEWSPYFNPNFFADTVNTKAVNTRPLSVLLAYPTVVVGSASVPATNGRQQDSYSHAQYGLPTTTRSGYTPPSWVYGDGDLSRSAVSQEFGSQCAGESGCFHPLGPPHVSPTQAEFDTGTPWPAPEVREDGDEACSRANPKGKAIGSGSRKTSFTNSTAPQEKEGANLKKIKKSRQAEADGSDTNPASQGGSRRRKLSSKQQPPTFIQIGHSTNSSSSSRNKVKTANPRAALLTPVLTPSSGPQSTTVPAIHSTTATAYLSSPAYGAWPSEPSHGQSTRVRNQVAATKCRAKSRAAIQQLEELAREAEEQHRSLVETKEELKEMVWQLNMQLLEHHGCGSELIEQYIQQSARRRVENKVREANTTEKLFDLDDDVDDYDEDDDDDNDDNDDVG